MLPPMEVWSAKDKLFEAMHAPVGAHPPRPETRVIERDGWYQVVTPGAREGNEVVVARLSDDEADDVIDRTIAEYAALGVDFRWMVGPFTTPSDIGARLSRRGFVQWGARAMTCDPRTLEVRRVDG